MAAERGTEIPAAGPPMPRATRPPTAPRDRGPDPADGRAKGYAISFMFDVLAGVLTGSAFGADGRALPAGCSERGRTPVAHHRRRRDGRPGVVRLTGRSLVDATRRPRRPRGADRILVPGELEDQNLAEHTATGITLTATTWTSLVTLGAEPRSRPAAHGGTHRMLTLTVSLQVVPATWTPSSRPSPSRPSGRSPTSPAACTSTSPRTSPTTTTSPCTSSTPTRPRSRHIARRRTSRSGGGRRRARRSRQPGQHPGRRVIHHSAEDNKKNNRAASGSEAWLISPSRRDRAVRPRQRSRHPAVRRPLELRDQPHHHRPDRLRLRAPDSVHSHNVEESVLILEGDAIAEIDGAVRPGRGRRDLGPGRRAAPVLQPRHRPDADLLGVRRPRRHPHHHRRPARRSSTSRENDRGGVSAR